jgi:hypothetical protein
MTTKPINYWVIAHAFTDIPSTFTDKGLNKFDPNDERSTKRLFARYVIPRVAKWSDERKSQLKRSLAFYLNDTKVLSDVLEFDLDNERPDPDDPRIYFRWMFEVLFPFDDPNLDQRHISQVVENDILKANFVAADFAGSVQKRFESNNVEVERLETSYRSYSTFCKQKILVGGLAFVLTKPGSTWLDGFARSIAEGPIGDEYLCYVLRPVLFSLVLALQNVDLEQIEFEIETRILEWRLVFQQNQESRDILNITLAKRANLLCTL